MTREGTRAHVRRALDKARATLSAAQERVARSHRALASSERRLIVEPSTPTAPIAASSRAELRASVTAYARRLRNDGLPPERVLVEVKTAVHETVSPTLGSSEVADLVDNVVRWTVDAYYEGQSPQSAHAGRPHV
ncbi:MAG TPA: hypothetical protein VM076_23980 [Gemmatimonadaceae bacterium]|nr:hypothetical protein [Gemmatimonadaceae bacterium]